MNAGTIIERIEETDTSDSAWLTQLIKEGPKHGIAGGGHGWLYRAARGLYYYRRRHRLTEEDLFRILRAKADDYARPVPDREIQDAITSAVRDLEDPDYQRRNRQKAWPTIDFERVHEIVTGGFGFRELKEASPVNLSNGLVTSDQVVSCLFSYNPAVSDPLICAALNKYHSVTKPLSEWLKAKSKLNAELSPQSYIVPNRMSRLQGINKKGGRSSRCEDNTGERTYLVVECDISKFDHHKAPTLWKPWVEKWGEQGLTVADACAALLWHLHQFAPLVLAVHSGGKSIHGWFPCRGIAEEQLTPFFRHAVKLGADPATWRRSQLVRMPGGTRENGKHQKILYYDPETILRRWEVAV